jgi:two-component system, OmpR family, response regulator
MKRMTAAVTTTTPNRLTPPLVPHALTAADLMTPDPKLLRRDDTVAEAVAFLSTRGFSAGPAIEEARRPVGVVSRTDLLHHDQRAARPRAAPLTQEGRSEPGDHVLLVDPCPDTVETMALLLRLWGYAVETVATGPEALEVALVDRPDAILMELALPGLDGLQVARRLRQSGGPIPLLVAVSGYGSAKDRARSREAGFSCHFVKPVCPEVVRAWLVANYVHAGG